LKRITRKNLKSDPFAQEVSTIWDWIGEHKDEVIRYGSIGLAVVLIAAGIFYYVRYQAGVREDALANALRIDGANVGGQPQPGMLQFATQDEKDKAWDKAFADVAAKYHGTQEGAIAEMYLASQSADKGDLAAAEKRYLDVVDSAPKAYASMARLALAETYEAEGKNTEAEKILRDAMNHPTITVSKDEATIQLAMLIGKTNPDEARKLLEPLRTSRTAISRAAVQALGDLGQQNAH
jgi:predicted negative regulator of RcsB-dependent stress response